MAETGKESIAKNVGLPSIRSNVGGTHNKMQTRLASGHPAIFPFATGKRPHSHMEQPRRLGARSVLGKRHHGKGSKGNWGTRVPGLEINPEYCAIAERRIAQQVLELEAV